MRPRALWLWLLVFAACSSAGGEAQAPPRARPGPAAKAEAKTKAAPTSESAVVLSPPGSDPIRVRVELARSPSERQRGLMFRKQMDADAGMLFLFERPQQLSFWMRNTYIPLDMIFIEASMRVLGVVENAEPLTETSRRVPGDSQYVLEVNGGFSRAHGIGPGTQVRFEGVEPQDRAGR